MTQREIGIIVSKLESLHEDIRDILSNNANLTARITKMEHEWSWFKGVAYTISGLCSVAIVYITKTLKGF